MNSSLSPGQKIYRIIVGLLGIGFLYVIWPYISQVVVMLVFAFLFTSILLPGVDYFERKIKSRGLSVLIMTVAVSGVFVIFFVSFASGFLEQARDFYDRVNEDNYVEKMNIVVQRVTTSLPDFISDFKPTESDLATRLQGIATNAVQKFISVAKSSVSFLFTTIMVIIFTVILLLEYHNFKRTLAQFIPNKYFEIGLRLMYNIEKQVSNYLRGQLLVASSVAIMSIIGLFILNQFGANLTLIVFIGTIAGLANLIPLVGPFVGMIPAILIAFMNNLGLNGDAVLSHTLLGFIPSPFFILDIILMFILVQLIDNNIITPLFVGESVGLHPIMVMIALLIGGTLLGPLGMLFAVPAAGIIKVIGQEISFVTKNAHLL